MSSSRPNGEFLILNNVKVDVKLNDNFERTRCCIRSGVPSQRGARHQNPGRSSAIGSRNIPTKIGLTNNSLVDLVYSLDGNDYWSIMSKALTKQGFRRVVHSSNGVRRAAIAGNSA